MPVARGAAALARSGRNGGSGAGARAAAAPAVSPSLTLDGAFLRRWLADALAQEIAHRRLFLWSPVFAGLGVLGYFAADREPSLWAPALGGALCAAGAVLARRRAARAPVLALTALALVFAGFAAATLRARLVAAPILDRMMVARVTAFVETVDDRGAGG
ncbi:MAG: competence protein ComEC, partial [Methylobacteriaceae bacterium]|nr:competence protein ComEC [Methylobacteriaceae bacterium]